MFSEAPELYDLIYGSFKDYDDEAESIAQVLKRLAPTAKVILDVGCGTGEHARHLQTEHGYIVHGLDIQPAFLEVARVKLPDSQFWEADMADFDLGVRFDVILCLFSSIGYLCEVDRVEQALRCFQRHLHPDGVLVVEPWFAPGSWNPGKVYVQSAESESDGLHVVRMSHSSIEGRISKLEFHYLVGRPGGVDYRVEHHELGLFTTAELTACFERAGLDDVSYEPDGLIGRGMFVARVR